MTTRSKPDSAPGAPHRQWNELLQEMRVMQTGIQILAAFLITLPFQNRFQELAQDELLLYFILLGFAAILILLLLLPVMVHRHFFGQRLKPTTVLLGHTIVRVVGIGAGLLTTGCVWFVVLVLQGWNTALWAGGALMLVTIFLLVILPRMLTPRKRMPKHYKE